MMEASVKIVGADNALRALRTLEPETGKQVGRKMSDIGRVVAMAANARAPKGPPVSGWKKTSGVRGSRSDNGWPAWGAVKATSKRRAMTVTVLVSSPDPAIASFAESLGRGNRVTSEKGQRLVDYAISRWAPIVALSKRGEGRVARGAIGASYPEIMRNIEEARDLAAEAVQRRMP